MRVVEVGSGFALAYCGNLFADQGASVTKIEAAGGESLGAWPPFVDSGTAKVGALQAWLNAKKQVIPDSDVFQAEDKFAQLLEVADILLDGREMAESGQNETTLSSAMPRVVVELSWFGKHGPYAQYKGADEVCRALAGLVQPVGPADGPPALRNQNDAGIVGGLAAFTAGIAGLYGSGRSALSVSVHEANVALAELQVASALGLGQAQPRFGINRFLGNFPMGVYATRQGWLGIMIVTPAQWRTFCALLDLPHLVEDPRYASKVNRWKAADELEAVFAPRLRARTAQEWFDLGLAQKLPFALVPTMEELLSQQVLRERGAFTSVSIGGVRFEAPAVPFGFKEAGAHTGLRGNADSPEANSALPGRERAEELPLSGTRVVDLTMGWAGPLATRQLADMGAEILKVESCQHPDWWRGTEINPAQPDDVSFETRLQFQFVNRNKTGVTLDLRSVDGRELFIRLVASSDAVVNNFSAGTMDRLGLGYDALKAVNPDIIMLSMPAFGTGNAWSMCRAYGPTLEQASGMPTVTGEAAWVPTLSHVAYGDPIGGVNGSAALALALLDKKRSGRGRLMDLSQVECMLPLIASSIIEQSLTGRATRRGNRHPVFSPNGCFRCAGADEWIVISITTAEEWHALCATMDLAAFASDAALSAVDARRAREEEIEEAIANWCRARSGEKAMALLQAAGVPAGVARNPKDLLDDPHLMARGFWQRVDRPFVGEHFQPSLPVRRHDGGPFEIRQPAPTLGQHTVTVLGGLLGLTREELEDLSRKEVIGNRPVPVRKVQPIQSQNHMPGMAK